MVFSDDGKVAGRAYREFQQHFPRPGWVEHDAGEIWNVTEAVAREAIADAGADGADLTAICITNQRTTKAHLARAALEAMAYQTVDAIRAMEAASGIGLEELRADGGATANGWMLQFQADLLGVPVVVPEISETTALGAAYLAGWRRAPGRRTTCTACGRDARYEPKMGDDEREELMEGWRRAIETTRNHSR